MNNIVLIGFVGSGKSTIGKALAQAMERAFIDMDNTIEIGEKKALREIYEKEGEKAYRDLESGYLEKLRTKKNKVIATGGDVILREDNITILQQIGTIIFLHTPHDVLLNRMLGAHRPELMIRKPLLSNATLEETLRELMKVREPLYFHAANIIVQTQDKTVEDIVDEIVLLV